MKGLKNLPLALQIQAVLLAYIVFMHVSLFTGFIHVPAENQASARELFNILLTILSVPTLVTMIQRSNGAPPETEKQENEGA